MNIMSYNIHHGVGLDEQLNMERIINVIKESEAKIIGLQEVDKYYGERSDFIDQAKEMAKLLNYHYAFGANICKEPLVDRKKDRKYGTAILSKFPIIESENIPLTSFGKEQRGLLKAVIIIEGRHLNLYNTHLSLDVPSKIAQVKEIIDVTSRDKEPKLLFGDFNALPGSEEIQLLMDRTDFIDSFSNMHGASTFPVCDPDTRIDYIFTSSQIEISNKRVVHTNASDHLPIVVKIKV